MARSHDDDQAEAPAADDQAEAPVAEAAPAAASYRVLRGVNYPTAAGEARAEAGTVVTDLPDDAIEWLLADGVIEPA